MEKPGLALRQVNGESPDAMTLIVLRALVADLWKDHPEDVVSLARPKSLEHVSRGELPVKTVGSHSPVMGWLLVSLAQFVFDALGCFGGELVARGICQFIRMFQRQVAEQSNLLSVAPAPFAHQEVKRQCGSSRERNGTVQHAGCILARRKDGAEAPFQEFGRVCEKSHRSAGISSRSRFCRSGA